MRKKISPLSITFLSLIILVVSVICISCKKKDVEPVQTPVPQPTPDMKVHKPFEYRLLQMKNSYEVTHNKDFPGYAIRRVGLGLRGGEDPEVPVFEIGDLLYDIGDKITSAHHFQSVNNDLITIGDQISALTQQIKALAAQLKIEDDEILNQMNILAAYGNVNYILTAWEGGNPFMNLMDFSNAASNFENNPTDPNNISNMNLAKASDSAFVAQCLNPSSTYYMVSCIDFLHDLLTGPTRPLRTIVTTIIDNFNAGNVQINDGSQALAAYGLLESYFLSYITYQTQALTINLNALKYHDSTGQASKDYLEGKYQPRISEEITEFLRCVDILYKNLNDYRLSVGGQVYQLDRFNHDMNYLNYGIAPDDIWINVLARAQFVSNLILDGLGSPYPVMCGYILTPWNYTNGNSPIVNQLTLNFDNGHPSTVLKATSDSSRIPYTYWTLGNDVATCTPDNVWYTYRLGDITKADPGWPSNQEIGITIEDNGYYTPWAHSVPINGSVKTMFYNPRNPSETSPSYSNTCNMQFGYFSLTWPWGYMYLADFQHSNWHSDLVSIWHYLDPSKNSYAPTSPFFCYYGPTGKAEWLYNNIPQYSYPSDCFGQVKLSYTSGVLGGQSSTALGDQRYCNVVAGFNSGKMSNSMLMGWGGYSVIYNSSIPSYSQPTIYVTIGTQRIIDVKAENGQSFYVFDNIEGGTWQSPAQNMWITESMFGPAGNFPSSTPATPGFSTILTCDNFGGTWTGSLTTIIRYQLIYSGFWNIGK